MSSDLSSSSGSTLAKWLRFIIVIVFLISSILMIMSVIRLGAIPSRYLIIGVILYSLAVAEVTRTLVKPKRPHRIITIITLIIALVIAGVNIYGISILRSTSNLLSGIQAPDASYVTYAIVAQENEETTTTLDTATSIATVSNDPLRAKVLEALNIHTPAAVNQAIDSVSALEGAFTNQGVELAAIREESLRLVEEEDEEFHSSLITLRTLRIEADTIEVAQNLDATTPYAIYISGIDTYGQISTVSRSDVNMLAVVNPDKRQILLVNIPRDYYVPLHNIGEVPDKLTHAGLYGVHTSRQTLENLFEVKIPYYVRINFTSLVDVIDAIGPIEVHSDHAFKSFQEGVNTLNSTQALEFSRERYSFSEGDRQRGRNQQRVIEAVIAEMSRPETATRLPQIIGSVEDSVETNLSEASLKSIINNQIDDIRGWNVTSIAVDGAGDMLPTYSYGAQPLYVMIPDAESVATAKEQIMQRMKQE